LPCFPALDDYPGLTCRTPQTAGHFRPSCHQKRVIEFGEGCASGFAYFL
jgi:hypothetical protein